METLKIFVEIGADGILHLDIPTSIRNMSAEVLIVYTPQAELSQEEWVERVKAAYGSLADDPIERGADLPADIRDEIE